MCRPHAQPPGRVPLPPPPPPPGCLPTPAGAFDIGLALHACGAASDHALRAAAQQGAAAIVSPCCIGKVAATAAAVPAAPEPSGEGQPADGPGQPHPAGAQARPLHLPRSQWMDRGLGAGLGEAAAAGADAGGAYAALARAADFSHADGHGYSQLAAAAKTNVELDRGLALAEAGYRVALVRLLQPQLTAKSDMLVCAPPGGGWAWTWQALGAGEGGGGWREGQARLLKKQP